MPLIAKPVKFCILLPFVLLLGCSSNPTIKPGNLKYLAINRPQGPIQSQLSSQYSSKSEKRDLDRWSVLSHTPVKLNEYFSKLQTNHQGIARNVDLIIRMPHCWLLIACKARNSLYQSAVNRRRTLSQDF